MRWLSNAESCLRLHNGVVKKKKQGVNRPSVARVFVTVAVLALAVWMFLPQILNGFTSGRPIQIDASASEPLRQLASLEVAEGGSLGDAPPYSRDQFGDGWADLDADGCNTRNEILARDLDHLDFGSDTQDCVVQAGTLEDPYTDSTIVFQRGEQTSAAVQIDHVVALANGWQAGAWKWSNEDRLRFANDPLNLLAVEGNANQAKGAAAADQWLPDNKAYRCDYAARQVAVKYKWSLTVTRNEQKTLNDILKNCPSITF